jgi:hypothetical protein
MRLLAMIAKLAKLTTNLGALALRNPSGVRHVLGSALSASEDVLRPEGDVRSFPAASVWEITQDGVDPRCELHLFPNVRAAISPLEALALASLIRSRGYKIVFEFGTYKGVSTTQFALNVGPGGKVFTLDLPEDNPSHQLSITSMLAKRNLGASVSTAQAATVTERLSSRTSCKRQAQVLAWSQPLVLCYKFLNGT